MMFPWGEIVPLHQSFAQPDYNQEDSHQITRKSNVIILYQENFEEFPIIVFCIPNKGKVSVTKI